VDVISPYADEYANFFEHCLTLSKTNYSLGMVAAGAYTTLASVREEDVGSKRLLPFLNGQVKSLRKTLRQVFGGVSDNGAQSSGAAGAAGGEDRLLTLDDDEDSGGVSEVVIDFGATNGKFPVIAGNDLAVLEREIARCEMLTSLCADLGATDVLQAFVVLLETAAAHESARHRSSVNADGLAHGESLNELPATMLISMVRFVHASLGMKIELLAAGAGAANKGDLDDSFEDELDDAGKSARENLRLKLSRDLAWSEEVDGDFLAERTTAFRKTLVDIVGRDDGAAGPCANQHLKFLCFTCYFQMLNAQFAKPQLQLDA